ncbi:MAG: NUDIX hydrolase, partial [Deferribacterales bacterium]
DFNEPELVFTDRLIPASHRYWKFINKEAVAPFTSIDTSDWVVIIPFTTENNVVLVEQFRPVVNITTLEFPGGAINQGEKPINAAIRELEEETGLISDDIVQIGELRPNPAIMSNRCFIFLAKGCSFTGRCNFDTFEDIKIKKFNQIEIEELIKSGQINHSIVVAAYGIYKLL